MPSVEMKRTTRVFGARILRSGRRLWTGPWKLKHARLIDGKEWIGLFDNCRDGGIRDSTDCKEHGKQEPADMDIDVKLPEPEVKKSVPGGSVADGAAGRMWGSVYQRKRKRVDPKSPEVLDVDKGKRTIEDKMYGKQFVRKQCKKRITEIPVVEPCATFSRQKNLQFHVRCNVLVASVRSSCDDCSLFTSFLNSVLRYMTRASLRLSQLSAFLLFEPIASIYTSCGVQFLQDSNSNERSGGCKILGVWSSIPLFAVDFSAVPYCFLNLHSSLHLRFARLSYLVISSKYLEIKGDIMRDKEESVYNHFESDQFGSVTVLPKKVNVGNNLSYVDQSMSKIMASEKDKAVTGWGFNPAGLTHNISGATMQFRNGVNSRCVQKRSSLRSRRGQDPLECCANKINGAFVSDLCSCRHDSSSLCPLSSSSELRSSVRWSSTINIRLPKFSSVELAQDVDSACCSANLLIIESDRCYREEGAIIMLEVSPVSKQWILAIKKGGIIRYSFTVEKNMRSFSCNRITHAIIWSGDTGWKLEFSERREWFIFKELYRECCDRNVQNPTATVIPVPGVRKVLTYADNDDTPFIRPDTYITVKDDEVSRALARRTGNYDLDLDDEEWLKKFNHEFCSENEQQLELSAESFELIIDAFEEGSYCSPDEYSNEKDAVKLCLHLGRREVLEAVYSYWMKKRRQKRSALVKIFQYYQPKRVQVIPKHVLRKKRSFKRQASHVGKGKQRSFLKAMATEQDEFVEKNAILKVEEAKAMASKSECLAVLKRQKAQRLMEKADLATYRAAMAMRIAEATQLLESANSAASFYID